MVCPRKRGIMRDDFLKYFSNDDIVRIYCTATKELAVRGIPLADVLESEGIITSQDRDFFTDEMIEELNGSGKDIHED